MSRYIYKLTYYFRKNIKKIDTARKNIDAVKKPIPHIHKKVMVGIFIHFRENKQVHKNIIIDIRRDTRFCYART